EGKENVSQKKNMSVHVSYHKLHFNAYSIISKGFTLQIVHRWLSLCTRVCVCVCVCVCDISPLTQERARVVERACVSVWRSEGCALRLFFQEVFFTECVYMWIFVYTCVCVCVCVCVCYIPPQT